MFHYTCSFTHSHVQTFASKRYTYDRVIYSRRTLGVRTCNSDIISEIRDHRRLSGWAGLSATSATFYFSSFTISVEITKTNYGGQYTWSVEEHVSENLNITFYSVNSTAAAQIEYIDILCNACITYVTKEMFFSSVSPKRVALINPYYYYN